MKKRKAKIAPKKVLVVRAPNKIIVGTPAEMIRIAVSGKADLDKLEKLLLIQERWESTQAKKAYYKAMTLFKANLPQIQKDKKANYAAGGSQVKYSWASLFNVVDKVTPRLSEYGLSVAWFHKQSEENLTVTCRITHELGYSEETSLTAKSDKTGCKNDIQALGSANAYLERYTFLALLGTATKDQDDDGTRADSGKPVEYIGDKELNFLRDNFLDLAISEKKFIEYMKIESLEKMFKTDYPKAQAAIEAKRKQKEGK